MGGCVTTDLASCAHPLRALSGAYQEVSTELAVHHEEQAAKELEGNGNSQVMLILKRNSGVQIETRRLKEQALGCVELWLHVGESRATAVNREVSAQPQTDSRRGIAEK